MAQDIEQEIREARRRIAAIKRKITRLELASSGTLLTRTKTCGRKSCRCARDASARHGPYHEWSRREGGRLVHKTISDEQAREVAKAIANYREIQRLLRCWEKETVRIILSRRNRNSL